MSSATKGDLEGVERGYREVLPRQSAYPPALINLGFLCAQTGRLAEAEGLLRHAVQADPGNANAHTNLGFALRLAGNATEALSCHARAVELAPESATACVNHATALLLHSELERGWEGFEARWGLASMAVERRDFMQPQ